jgi:dihydrofolate reductase
LKSEEGEHIWLMGGAQIANTLLQAGLVDAMILSIHPIVLGSGIPLFANGGKRIPYDLVGTTSYPDGLVQLEYKKSVK